MKWAAFCAAVLFFTDPLKISTINRIKSAAMQAYASGNYAQAAQLYQYLIDSLGVIEEEVLINAGHSYFQISDYEKAKQAYAVASVFGNKNLQSVAHQQLGVIANREGKFQDALQHFREALKANPSNEEARYNYELLKKKLKDQNSPQQQNQQQQQQNDQQQNQQQKNEQSENQQNSDNKQQQKQQKQGGEQQKEEESRDKQQNDEQQNLQQGEGKQERKSKIDPQKAKEILESMRNQEIQYLQQQKRKATQPRDKNKPDW
jgi:Ca-activated chloride channel family protein